MDACPEQIIHYMHEYLDDDIPEDHKQILEQHLGSCLHCKRHFYELKKSIFYVRSLSGVTAPAGFVNRVMDKLPKEKRRVGMRRWLGGHSFAVSAFLFLVLMAGAVFLKWNDAGEFSVTKNKNLVVKGHTVIVPKGKVVGEDITVKNGNVRIEGKVKGNVTVIHGKEYMASAGDVTGDVKEINEVFDWVWYNIKETGQDALAVHK
ncbi:anti-sigma factor family protein [Heyndrickxia acidiproducens]|uniref:anti-sigma factor family protein n=1 Tax=Heyndrickxia acidiproducens TaxID=1121084 RepID=UPI000370F8AF|nr:anti-sigma factor [Heyndrickxia acidiproducens]